MYHLRLSGKHYEMGKKMGGIFKKCNAQFPINLDAFQRGFGKESGSLLREFFPEAYEEIKGITDVIGYANEIFTSWMMCMGCCLYTDKDNSVEVRGCTAFSFIDKGNIYYARDNDLPPYLKKISKSVYYRPEGGNSFIMNTSSFINGEEGINEHGLVAAMTFVMPKVEEIKPGINSIFLVRYILEKCKNVEEGIDALQKLPIASSCNILLADRSANMVVVECNPFAINIRYPDKNINGENFIITVNHFTSDEMKKHDASNGNAYLSKDRYQTAYNALSKGVKGTAVEYTKEILSGKCGFMCQYKKEMDFDTIWSTVFDINNNRIHICEGNPSRVKFEEDSRMKFNANSGVRDNEN